MDEMHFAPQVEASQGPGRSVLLLQKSAAWSGATLTWCGCQVARRIQCIQSERLKF